MLDSPDDPEDLWLATDGVPAARPLMQGDVLTGLPIGADGEPATGMILTHPCSMRAGKKLRPRQTIAQILQQTIAQILQQPIALGQWSESFYDWMPLPGLALDGGTNCAADFRLVIAVPTAALEEADRLAALSEIGVHHLQQRLTHHLTRVVVDLPTFAEHSAPTLLEVELQEEWVSDAAQGADGDESQEFLTGAGDEFQEVLDADDRRLRGLLAESHSRAQATREIRTMIRARRDARA